MLGTECLHSIQRFLEHFRRWADDQSHVVGHREALSRQQEEVLFGQQLARKVRVIDDALQVIDLNAHHGIHGAGWLDDREFLAVLGLVHTQRSVRAKDVHIPRREGLQIRFIFARRTQQARDSSLNQCGSAEDDLREVLEADLELSRAS